MCLTIADILLIGAALSMDAFSVSLSSGMVYTGLTLSQKRLMPVMFGVFQGLMPMAGYFLGYLFKDFITKWQGPVSLIILGVIGVNMLREGIGNLRHGEEERAEKKLTFVSLTGLAVATSIDAFAVGVSFAASGVSVGFESFTQNIFTVSAMIAVITYIFCTAAIALGKKAAEKLGNGAEILGGSILIIIGLKNMFF